MLTDPACAEGGDVEREDPSMLNIVLSKDASLGDASVEKQDTSLNFSIEKQSMSKLPEYEGSVQEEESTESKPEELVSEDHKSNMSDPTEIKPDEDIVPTEHKSNISDSDESMEVERKYV